MARILVVEPRLYAQFAQSCEGAEAESPFALRFIGHSAVEVAHREFGSLIEVAVEEGLANLGKQVGTLFVLVPIVCGAIGCAGSAAPEGFLVERISFGGNTAHHVCTQRAVAKGQ